jgi:hypothetical protein
VDHWAVDGDRHRGRQPGEGHASVHGHRFTPEGRQERGRNYRRHVPLIFHWGGPRHGDVDVVPDEQVASGILVYDGPQWISVYERSEPPQKHTTPKGRAEVWVVRE